MKKIFSLFLCLTLCMSAFSFDFKVNGIAYNITNSATHEVAVTYTCSSWPQPSPPSAHSNYSGNVVIPSSVVYNNVSYDVTKIDTSAFAYCSGLTSVTIPNSIITIGMSAFSQCTGLTSVDIPNSVTTIDEGAFSQCTGLTSIDIPNSVTTLAGFNWCTGLTSVDIPNSVTTIGKSAFCFCSGLTSVDIPNSVTTIGNGAFCSCTGLTSVDIPNSVTTIGNSAFEGCTGLTSITIPGSVVNMENYVFGECFNLTNVILSANFTTEIEPFVTYENSYNPIDQNDVTSIIITDNVTTIPNNFFHGCDEVTEIYCYAAIPPTIRANTFEDYDVPTLYVPANSINLYSAKAYWRNFFIMPLPSASHTINVTSNNIQQGTAVGGGTYEEGQTAQIIAIPNNGYAFQQWNDGNTNNPRNVSVSSDSTFTAYFTADVSGHDTVVVNDTVYTILQDTIYNTEYDTIYNTLYDTIYVTQTDTIYLEYDGTQALQYPLEEYGVYYFNGMVYNQQNRYIKLYFSDGRLVTSGSKDIDMSFYANGIYIVTDGKGGFLKINHYR